MITHLKKMHAGRSLPSLKARINVDWKIFKLFTLIALAAFCPATLAMDPVFASSFVGLSAKASNSGQERRGEDIQRTPGADGVDQNKQELGKQLWRAVDLQNIQAIYSLIEANADVNYPNERGTTPFMLTAHRPIEIFQTLLKAKGNIYCQSKSGSTALSMAAARQDMPITSMLLTSATALTPTQKEAVKAWLYANKKLEKMRRIFLPKDTRILVAQNIMQILTQTLHQQVIQAGGLGAIEQAHEAVIRWKTFMQFAARVGGTVDSKEDAITPLLNQYLNSNFLAHLVHQQSAWPKLVQSKKEVEELEIVTETTNQLKIMEEENE
jgi:hypothetical protein